MYSFDFGTTERRRSPAVLENLTIIVAGGEVLYIYFCTSYVKYVNEVYPHVSTVSAILNTPTGHLVNSERNNVIMPM